MNRSEGWEPYPGAATFFQAIAEGAMEELFKALGALRYTAEEDAEHLQALQQFAPAQLAAKLRKVHDRRFELLRKFPELRDPTIGPSHPQPNAWPSWTGGYSSKKPRSKKARAKSPLSRTSRNG